MASVVSRGTADRMAARIFFKVPRAGSGTPARYSSTLFGAPLPLAAELRLPGFTFFMREMLQEAPIQVYASARREAVLDGTGTESNIGWKLASASVRRDT
jgi:hypothetical protein